MESVPSIFRLIVLGDLNSKAGCMPEADAIKLEEITDMYFHYLQDYQEHPNTPLIPPPPNPFFSINEFPKKRGFL